MLIDRAYDVDVWCVHVCVMTNHRLQWSHPLKVGQCVLLSPDCYLMFDRLWAISTLTHTEFTISYTHTHTHTHTHTPDHHTCTHTHIRPHIPPPSQALHSQPELEDGRPLAWKAPRTGKVVRSIHAGEPTTFMIMHV